MSGRASDATRAGPGPLEVSFTFQFHQRRPIGIQAIEEAIDQHRDNFGSLPDYMKIDVEGI